MDDDTNVRFYFSSDEHFVTGIMAAGILFSPPSQLTVHLRAIHAERDRLHAELTAARKVIDAAREIRNADAMQCGLFDALTAYDKEHDNAM